jgi:hypothetical protein
MRTYSSPACLAVYSEFFDLRYGGDRNQHGSALNRRTRSWRHMTNGEMDDRGARPVSDQNSSVNLIELLDDADATWEDAEWQ